jgi:hypothetical protein
VKAAIRQQINTNDAKYPADVRRPRLRTVLLRNPYDHSTIKVIIMTKKAAKIERIMRDNHKQDNSERIREIIRENQDATKGSSKVTRGGK